MPLTQLSRLVEKLVPWLEAKASEDLELPCPWPQLVIFPCSGILCIVFAFFNPECPKAGSLVAIRSTALQMKISVAQA